MNARTPMSEPGESTPPDEDVPRHRDEIDHDDLVGFFSPAALEGRTREVAAPVAPEPEPEPVIESITTETVFEPEPEPEREPQPVVQPVFRTADAPYGHPPQPSPVSPREPERVVRAAPSFARQPAADPVPAWARETPLSEQPAGSWGRRREQPAPIEGAMSLYTTYALILFAVPTFGVSAVIALFSVLTHPSPPGALAASHYQFQKRTLIVGAIVALIGGVLIAVGLGVFVLFLLAIWLIIRGAGGVLKLKANRPIDRPTTWLL